MYGSTKEIKIETETFEDEHHEVDPAFRSAVFGLNDGLCTNLNLVLAVYFTYFGANAHDIIVVTGMAGLFAGASSMACGEWLSVRAEKDAKQEELESESRHLMEYPDAEASHLGKLLEAMGFTKETVESMCRDLSKLSPEQQLNFHARFELGIIPEESGSAWKNAISMWFCFALGAFVPLLPWLLTTNNRHAFITTLIISAVFLILTSAFQSYMGGATVGKLPWVIIRQISFVTLAVILTVAADSVFTKLTGTEPLAGG